jgi:glutamate racemase
MDKRPIGVFDSGIGGLSLVAEIRKQLPRESVVYFADVARQPFGEKSPEEVIRISAEISSFLAGQGAKAVVVACSTASAVALAVLREKFPIPVVGIITPRLIDDVLKTTKNKKVGVISTELTARSASFRKAIEAADPAVAVYSVPCSRLVNMISAGDIYDEKIVKTADRYILPLVEKDVDTLILGCTHFNFIADVIGALAEKKMSIVSPPSATVGTLADILREKNASAPPAHQPSYRYLATGDSAEFARLVDRLWKGQGTVTIEHHEWSVI